MIPVWPDDGVKKKPTFIPKVVKAIWLKLWRYTSSQKVTGYLGYFWKKICQKGLSKIAQIWSHCTHTLTHSRLHHGASSFCANVYLAQFISHALSRIVPTGRRPILQNLFALRFPVWPLDRVGLFTTHFDGVSCKNKYTLDFELPYGAL